MFATHVTALLAFSEGLALIVSPCILPILPIILSGSLTGSKKRPFGIILGFIILFSIVTLFSRQLIQIFHISPDHLRVFSFTILMLLAVLMISDKLSEWFTSFTSKLAGFGSNMKSANDTQGGFFSGILFGGLIGIIWTPCAGPILAAVIVQVVVQDSATSSIITVLAFALGVGLPMLLIALFGRKAIDTLPGLKTHTRLIRKILGIIILASVLVIAFVPLDILTQPSAPKTRIEPEKSGMKLLNGLAKPYPAPAISGIDAWINSQPLSLNQLHGKVILIDFWTYSCINCIRTFPYLKDWYAKYRDKGLIIIGIHSPEFIFEHNVDNVKNAVKQFGILYPVALDNHFVTWQNYNNRYWPAHYLINKEGEVAYVHFGEGEYDVTENNIRNLLGMQSMTPQQQLSEPSVSLNQTPETYLGYARGRTYGGSPRLTRDDVIEYHFPRILPKHRWALNGKWMVDPEKIVAVTPNAAIKIHFVAKKVYVVMGAPKPTIVTVYLDDKKVASLKVNANQLYTALDLAKLTNGLLTLRVSNPGVEIYTFTFGS